MTDVKMGTSDAYVVSGILCAHCKDVIEALH